MDTISFAAIVAATGGLAALLIDLYLPEMRTIGGDLFFFIIFSGNSFSSSAEICFHYQRKFIFIISEDLFSPSVEICFFGELTFSPLSADFFPM